MMTTDTTKEREWWINTYDSGAAERADQLCDEIDALRARAEKAEVQVVTLREALEPCRDNLAQWAQNNHNDRESWDAIAAADAAIAGAADVSVSTAREVVAERDALAKRCAILGEHVDQIAKTLRFRLAGECGAAAFENEIAALSEQVTAALAGTANVDVFTAAEIVAAYSEVASEYGSADDMLRALKAARGGK